MRELMVNASANASRDALRPATHRQFIKGAISERKKVDEHACWWRILGPGESEYVDVGLAARHNYRIYAHPEDQTVDFDLHIYDESGNLVGWDENYDADAYGVIQPIFSGPFRVVVNAAQVQAGTPWLFMNEPPALLLTLNSPARPAA
jgi:hypothetical protein